LIFDAHLNMAGLAIAVIVNFTILSILLLGLSFAFKSFRDSFDIGTIKEIINLKSVKEILKLGLPSMLMTFLN